MHTIIQTLTAHAFLMAVSLRCSFWTELVVYNRPLPWCSKPLFQSEARCEAIDVKMIYYIYSHANKTPFHKKGFALTLVLKVRIFGTRKFSWLYFSLNYILSFSPAHPQRWILLKKSVLSVYYLSVYCKHGGLWYIFLYQVFILKAV